MTGLYESYEPKFYRRREADPGTRKPGERACDHLGCVRAGRHRAPKGRDQANEYWHFCLEHAAEYNRRWDYFAGMSETELDSFRKRAEAGHRPTWTFKASRLDRVAAAMRDFQAGRRADPFGLFRKAAPQQPRVRRLSRLQLLALETLALDERADASHIRTRYKELVKRYHPDVNGGDRSAEHQLQRVIRAYQTMKSTGLA
jgi:hypothetical protein